MIFQTLDKNTGNEFVRKALPCVVYIRLNEEYASCIFKKIALRKIFFTRMLVVSKKMLIGFTKPNKCFFATLPAGENFKIKGRLELISCLTDKNNDFDVLIIGGGATGTGMLLQYYYTSGPI